MADNQSQKTLGHPGGRPQRSQRPPRPTRFSSGANFEELKRSSTTTTPPAELARSFSGSREEEGSKLGWRTHSSSPGTSAFCFGTPTHRNNNNSPLSPTPYFGSSTAPLPPDTPTPEIVFTSLSLNATTSTELVISFGQSASGSAKREEQHASRPGVFGTGQPAIAHTEFTFSSAMVREQEPPKLPLAPTKGNSMHAQPKKGGGDRKPNTQGQGQRQAANQPEARIPSVQAEPRGQLVFGRPSALGGGSQPFSQLSSVGGDGKRPTQGRQPEVRIPSVQAEPLGQPVFGRLSALGGGSQPFSQLGSMGGDGKPLTQDRQPEARIPSVQAEPLGQPVFGRPSALGGAPQPFSQTQPLQRPANTSAPRQASGNRNDAYSNLFIPSKSNQHRLDSQNPRVVPNPLSKVSDWTQEQVRQNNGPQSNSSSIIPAVSQNKNDNFAQIIQPPTFPTWQPKPVPQPMFSSQAPTNPYFKPREAIDLTALAIGSATNASLFDDGFGAADPYTYIDTAKANENIKALLEGAMEDEDDKPRTRRRRQQMREKAEELADKLKGLTVQGESGEGEVEEGEEEEEEDDGTIEGLKVKLLPHQIDGVNWMRDKELGTKKTRGVLPKGGILADDMGLGKTIQSIALLLTNPKPTAEELAKSKRKLPPNLDKGTLVVAPLALIRQWEGEIENRVESSHRLSVCVHHGPQRTKRYKDLKKYDVVLTTYGTLASEHAGSEGELKVGCFGIHWYRVILDEAHSIKNRNAKATKAACALNAEYRWCLTGTPMQNNLDELQSLIHFLRIKPYEDLNAWRDQITRPMSNGRGGLAIKRLQVYLKAFMKRRTKDILKEEGALKNGSHPETEESTSSSFKIVKRTVEKVEAEFTVQERAFYDRLETRTDKSLERMMAGNKVSYASALTLLLRLRQACNHPMLIRNDLAEEKEAFVNASSARNASRVDVTDSLADLLGGLSVKTKQCDICQIDLSAKEVAAGAIRCAECQEDIDAQDADARRRKMERKKEKAAKREKRMAERRKKNNRVIADSDDEEEVDDDDDDDDDDGIKPSHQTKRQVVNLVSDEEEEDDEDEDEEETSSSGEGLESDSDSDESSELITSTKIRRLLSILRADSASHKYIVFSFFTSMLDLIEPFLRRANIRYTRYDGQMRNDHREASLEKLRTDSRCRVLLCSLRAGSLGLNLTAANRVVILEPFWNPFVEEQAIDRVHRLNQTKDVVVYKLTVKNTVEARIVELQERKRELASQTIEGKAAVGKLTLQDMLKLFKRDAEDEHRVDGVGMRERGGLLERDSRETSVGSGERRVGAGGGAPQQARRKEHEVYGRRW